MAKRIISVLIIFALSFCHSFVFAAEENLIADGGFDNTVVPFTSLSIEALSPYSGMFCARVGSGEIREIEGGVLRFCEYMYPASFEEGSLYEFSMYIKAENVPDALPQMFVDYLSEENRIMFNISSIGADWQNVSGVFMAGKSGNLEFGFSVFTYTADTVVYVDEISLHKIKGKPVSMQILGPRSVFVPDTGSMTYEYSAVAIDDSGRTVTIVTGNLNVLGQLPDGVYFSGETNTLTVSAEGEINSVFTLEATPPLGFPGLSPYSVSVKTDKNYIENGDFTDFPPLSGYKAEQGSISLTKKDGKDCAAIETESMGENDFGACIVIDKTYVLRADKLYVFRALVSSDRQYMSRQTEATNGVIGEKGVIDITVSSAGRDATEVVSVISVPSDGVYQVNLNFKNADERPIYLSYVQFYAEELKATDIFISAPAHAAIPGRGVLNVPIDYAVRNQAGEIMQNAGEIVVFAEPENAGVSVSGKTLSVSSSAAEGEYKIYARMPENSLVWGVHTLTVSRAVIGDGSFETQNPGQWFKTAEPSVLNIVPSYEGIEPTDGDKMGKLTLNGSVSALLSDSVFLFEAGRAYVFSGWIKQVFDNMPATMSVIIYNAYAQSYTDNLALFQVDLSGSENVARVFVPQQDITGRIMLGFTAEGGASQVVLLDDIKITDAAVSCSGVYISGYPYPDRTLKGKHTFTSNFQTAELSTYRWLISSTADGVYVPIEGEISSSISVTGDMVNSYLKFEVAPASLSGPVYGAAVSSAPILILPKPSEGMGVPIETEIVNPNEDKPTVIESETIVSKKKGVMGVINIYSDSFQSKTPFVDTQNHWAKDDIAIMSAAGIVNGRGNMLFDPDEPITRAEFAAFLIRAFSLAPLYYTNSFSDVYSWDWYAGVVETVTKYDIARGIDSDTFMPALPITREQMTVMTVRALNLAGIIPGGGEDTAFKDSKDISGWASSAVNFANAARIINGNPDGFFNPAASATRAEAAAVIKRMITYVINS